MWTTTRYLLTHNAFYSVQCRQLWWSHLIRWPVSSSSYNSTFSLVACHLLCWIRVIFLVKLISESGESSLLWMNKFPLRNCTIARMRWRVWSNEEPWDRGYVWYVWYDAATRDVSVTELKHDLLWFFFFFHFFIITQIHYSKILFLCWCENTKKYHKSDQHQEKSCENEDVLHFPTKMTKEKKTDLLLLVFFLFCLLLCHRDKDKKTHTFLIVCLAEVPFYACPPSVFCCCCCSLCILSWKTSEPDICKDATQVYAQVLFPSFRRIFISISIPNSI